MLGAVLAGALLAAAPVAAQVWDVDDVTLELATSQASAQFGYAVAVGDFDGDTLPDLAIGAPYWSGPVALAGGEEVSLGGRVEFFRNLGNRSFARVGFDTGSQSNENLGYAVVMGDFDGNGAREVAVGAPGRDDLVHLHKANGAVRIYEWNGSAMALVDTLDDDGTPLPTSGEGTQFGRALGVGSFDCDAYDDLVVGAPYDGSVLSGAGIAHLFYGGTLGLSSVGSESLRPGVVLLTGSLAAGGILGTQNASEHFGWAFAAGDFNADDCDDLAIGVPWRAVSPVGNTGAVHILRGAPTGITLDGQQLLTRTVLGTPPVSTGELFGFALAAGNFNQSTSLCGLTNCYDDLAIGLPGASVEVPGQGTKEYAGQVMVAYGSSSGISGSGVTTLDENDALGATPTYEDGFGKALSAARLDKPTSVSSTGYEDLAVGTPNDGPVAGVVHLFFGSATGVDGGKAEQVVPQRPAYGTWPAVNDDSWGSVIEIADLDRDGWGDLVVGIPRKQRAGQALSGAVEVVWGGIFANGFDSFGVFDWSDY